MTQQTLTPTAATSNWLADPERVWIGGRSIDVDGLVFGALARAYLTDPSQAPVAHLRCEIYLDGVDLSTLRTGDLRARVVCDLLDQPVRMDMLTDAAGIPALSGNNLVFHSAPLSLTQTGAFHCDIELSTSDDWVPAATFGESVEAQIVVSPGWVAHSATTTEVCLRKVDAQIDAGGFRSGRIEHLIARLQQISTDVVYLLPFFRPGFFDQHTGQDVRKGELGSVYAVADFYQIDPQVVTPADQIDPDLWTQPGWLQAKDVVDGWAPFDEPAPDLQAVLDAGPVAAAQRWADEPLRQCIGRAQLRQLCQRAHALGKRVIFDLVLMQTSRDSPLIQAHPEWYALDDDGQPKIHQIAWLVYSDVALFDLEGNAALQQYLLDVAPYWIACCDFDGVRIDASQTVERAFLRRLKNRIQQAKPDALVLGETLCPLQEAVDIPVDMIYALMVDFHRDVETAAPLIDFLEEVHGTFAAGTVAMAYFENHDSPRATRIWAERYAGHLEAEPTLARAWRRVCEPLASAVGMAHLKNLQATLIDTTAGMWPSAAARPTTVTERPTLSGGTQLTWAIEWGSEWGEQERTDFENPTLLHTEQRDTVGADLVAAYRHLGATARDWDEIRHGQVYYHRNHGDGADAEDRVLAYTRYTGAGALLAVHNLDIRRSRWITVPLAWLPWTVGEVHIAYDSYQQLGLSTDEPVDPVPSRQGLRIGVRPLQTCLVRLRPGAQLLRKD